MMSVIADFSSQQAASFSEWAVSASSCATLSRASVFDSFTRHFAALRHEAPAELMFLGKDMPFPWQSRGWE